MRATRSAGGPGGALSLRHRSRRSAGVLEQGERAGVVDAAEQAGKRAQLGHGGAAPVALVEVVLEVPPLGGGEGAEHVGGVPFGEARVIGVRHRVTPFSWSTSRRARSP